MQVVQEIKVMRTSITAREKERAERATLVQQEKLSKAKASFFSLFLSPSHTGLRMQPAPCTAHTGRPIVLGVFCNAAMVSFANVYKDSSAFMVLRWCGNGGAVHAGACVCAERRVDPAAVWGQGAQDDRAAGGARQWLPLFITQG